MYINLSKLKSNIDSKDYHIFLFLDYYHNKKHFAVVVCRDLILTILFINSKMHHQISLINNEAFYFISIFHAKFVNKQNYNVCL